jgi:hypothetical protein
VTPAEKRRALIGDAAIADARRQANRAITEHPPTPELLEQLALTLAPAMERLLAEEEADRLAVSEAA